MSKTYRNTFYGKIRAETASTYFKNLAMSKIPMKLVKTSEHKGVKFRVVSNCNKLKLLTQKELGILYRAYCFIFDSHHHYLKMNNDYFNSIYKSSGLDKRIIINHTFDNLEQLLSDCEVLDKEKSKIKEIKNYRLITSFSLRKHSFDPFITVEWLRLLELKVVEVNDFYIFNIKYRSSHIREFIQLDYISEKKNYKTTDYSKTHKYFNRKMSRKDKDRHELHLKEEKLRFERLKFDEEVLNTPLKYILEDHKLFGIF